MTTNEYIRGVKYMGWELFGGMWWQRSYYEHIIRNERAYLHISDYIMDNRARWKEDTFHKVA